MRKLVSGVICATAITGSVVLGAGVAQADPAGQWSSDGLTYCEGFCQNYDKTAPRFSAEPSAYVCTLGRGPDNTLCGIVMDAVRILPPFSAGPIFRGLTSGS